jgi:hypothetical protein
VYRSYGVIPGRRSAEAVARLGFLLTSLAQRFMEVSGEGVGLCRAFTTRLVWLAGPLDGNAGGVGPPHIEHEADEYESDR